MKFLSKQICFQEVPDEVSLSFLMTGCGLKCKGCHSVEAQDGTVGTELTPEKLKQEIERTQGNITCVLFMGGEWSSDELVVLAITARAKGLKTCLYTGLSKIDSEIKGAFDYIKYGRYIKELGGLDNIKTNQRMYKGYEDITYKFQK